MWLTTEDLVSLRVRPSSDVAVDRKDVPTRNAPAILPV